jgi:DNA-directed RNA polymerase subunit omega
LAETPTPLVRSLRQSPRENDGLHYKSTTKGIPDTMMTSPRIDRLLDNVDSNYASVLVAAKRARQINSYYHNLGEGAFEEFPPPMIETASKNYLTIALEEVAAGKIKYHYR